MRSERVMLQIDMNKSKRWAQYGDDARICQRKRIFPNGGVGRVCWEFEKSSERIVKLDERSLKWTK